MEVTKMSTKGQVVIPESVRAGIDVGTAFVVTKTQNMIILKEIAGLTEEEKKELKELDKIWKDIDEGKGTSMGAEEFLKEMKSW
jgi:bifunctional DNA-binding transcriptional regulator/antitoxin component of YhaV-PrlF toxin-antitoxin module